MGRTPVVLSAVLLSVMFTAIGFVWGRGTAPKAEESAQECPECCLEDETCVGEAEWLSTQIGEVNEKAAADEIHKMFKACKSERQDITIKGLPELIRCRMDEAECTGMLKECRRK